MTSNYFLIKPNSIVPTSGGDRQYDRRDDGRDRRRDDRRDGDRHHDRNRDNRHDGGRQGHNDNRRNRTPPPMKKVDEQKAPVSLHVLLPFAYRRYHLINF